MASIDERLRERAGLLSELWRGEPDPSGVPVAASSPRSAADADAGVVVVEADDVARSLEGRLLRTREVALLFQVSERAVTDWARRGRLPSVRTPGGHRRYPAVAVRQLLEGAGLGPSSPGR